MDDLKTLLLKVVARAGKDENFRAELRQKAAEGRAQIERSERALAALKVATPAEAERVILAQLEAQVGSDLAAKLMPAH